MITVNYFYEQIGRHAGFPVLIKIGSGLGGKHLFEGFALFDQLCDPVPDGRQHVSEFL